MAFDNRKSLQQTPGGLARGKLVLQGHSAPGRGAAEQFIRTCFRQAYGADVRHFFPQLLTLVDATDGLQAVLGVRPASAAPLFLEQYLDAPVDSLLALHRGHGVDRESIMEVGNLASAGAGGSRWLIAALTAYLKGLGYRWAVFTAVPALGNAFSRFGIDLIPLGTAEKNRLPQHEQASWGSYYDCGPMVMAANVNQSYAALVGVVQPEQEYHALHQIWQQAYAHGQAGRTQGGLRA